MFSLSGVSVRVPGRILLAPLDLEIPGDRVVGLIGHNGSGKSTLLKVLARQIAPSTGAAAFAGRRLTDWPARALARSLAYLPQDVPLADGLLVRELVALGRYPWIGPLGRPGPDDRAAIESAMAHTGIAPLADRLVSELSGGERQCAAIAMCVAQQSRCLLLDEPTAALDIRHQIEVLEVLRGLNRAHGIGMVVVLHDINLAGRYCDELLALNAGRLVARGTPAEILDEDRLRAIYGVALGLLPHPGGRAPVVYLP